MKKIDVFLSSSMNGELDDVRKSISFMFQSEEVLRQFYQLYLLERTASTKELEEAYLSRIDESDLVLFIIGSELRSGVRKEYERTRAKKKRALIYINKISPGRTEETSKFIDSEIFRYNPGFYESTMELMSKIKEDLQNEVVVTFKSSVVGEGDSVLRVEPQRPESLHRYYPLVILQENQPRFSGLSEDQFIILVEEVRLKTGNLRESLLISEVGLVFFPRSWKLLNNRGLILDDMGLREHSFQSYLRAFEINPNDESVVYNVGNYYYSERDFSTAIDYYHLALNLNPQKKSALNKISIAYRNQKEYKKFLEYASIVYDLEPNEMYATNLILAYSENGLLEQAYRQLELSFEVGHEKRTTLKAYVDWENKNFENVVASLGHGETVFNLDIANALLDSYLAACRTNDKDAGRKKALNLPFYVHFSQRKPYQAHIKAKQPQLAAFYS